MSIALLGIALIVPTLVDGASIVTAWRIETVDDRDVDSFSPTSIMHGPDGAAVFYTADGLSSVAAALWLAVPSLGGLSEILLLEKAQARDAVRDSEGRFHFFYHKSGSGFWYARFDGMMREALVQSPIQMTNDASAILLTSGEIFAASVDGTGDVKLHYSFDPLQNWSSETVYSNGGQTVALTMDQSENIHLIYSRIGTNAGHSIKSVSGWAHHSIPSCYADIAAVAGKDGRIHAVCHNAMGLVYGQYDGQGWTMTQVDDRGQRFGWEADLAIDAGGTPHIVYHSLFNPDFPDWPTSWAMPYYATKVGNEWRIEVIDHTASGNGFGPSLALDAEGRPHVSYVTAWTSETNSGSIGTVDASFDLRYARPVLADLP